MSTTSIGRAQYDPLNVKPEPSPQAYLIPGIVFSEQASKQNENKGARGSASGAQMATVGIGAVSTVVGAYAMVQTCELCAFVITEGRILQIGAWTTDMCGGCAGGAVLIAGGVAAFVVASQMGKSKDKISTKNKIADSCPP